MFANRLEEAVASVQGSEAAILMGFDGIPVESYRTVDDLDIETVGMEFSVVLKEVKKAAGLLETGTAEEITIRTERKSTVLRVVNDEYFVAMMISAGGNLGKARYVLRMLAPGLREDLV
jgi:predicted regulator of Ras-like GTPase activity (Roadblock/LC7/MglB family)